MGRVIRVVWHSRLGSHGRGHLPSAVQVYGYTVSVYRESMIQSFADATTADLCLAAVPGISLEALAGDRKGQHSIRVNQQFRVTFRWEKHDAHDVCCEDYH